MTGAGLYDEVGDLAPGASTSYRISVPAEELGITGEHGVYWVGVHVLGADDGGRDGVADGRARTFIPLMPARGRRHRGGARGPGAGAGAPLRGRPAAGWSGGSACWAGGPAGPAASSFAAESERR